MMERTARVLRDVQLFAKRVEDDVQNFRHAEMVSLRVAFVTQFIRELREVGEAAIPKGLRDNSRAMSLFNSAIDRATAQSSRIIENAFATGEDSIPEFTNPVRAKNARGKRRTIEARLRGTMTGDDSEEDVLNGGRTMFGVLRLKRAELKSGRKTRIVRIRLVPHLTMLLQSLPRDLIRQIAMLTVRFQTKPKALPDGTKGKIRKMFLISPGTTGATCQTCRELNGVWMTEDAMQVALADLSPVLFHNNCRHGVQRSAWEGETPPGATIIDLPALNALISAGKLTRRGTTSSKRPRLRI